MRRVRSRPRPAALLRRVRPRLAVLVTPTGWRARCRDHGEIVDLPRRRSPGCRGTAVTTRPSAACVLEGRCRSRRKRASRVDYGAGVLGSAGPPSPRATTGSRARCPRRGRSFALLDEWRRSPSAARVPLGGRPAGRRRRVPGARLLPHRQRLADRPSSGPAVAPATRRATGRWSSLLLAEPAGSAVAERRGRSGRFAHLRRLARPRPGRPGRAPVTVDSTGSPGGLASTPSGSSPAAERAPSRCRPTPRPGSPPSSGRSPSRVEDGDVGVGAPLQPALAPQRRRLASSRRAGRIVILASALRAGR